MGLSDEPLGSERISKSNIIKGAADLVRGRPVRPNAVGGFEKLEEKLDLEAGELVDQETGRPGDGQTRWCH